jgi:hypothetical protein
MAFTTANVWFGHAFVGFLAVSADLNFLLADEKWTVDFSL